MKITSIQLHLLFLLFSFWTFDLFCQTTTSFTATGSQTWSVPSGVTEITIECWGAGASGGAAEVDWDPGSGGGGGGGAYSRSILTVSPSQSVSIFVGAGGAPNAAYDLYGNDGENSSVTIGGTTVCLAEGGKAGQGGYETNGSGGRGGRATNGIGNDLKYDGGDGQNGSLSPVRGGKGGGGAGAAGNAIGDVGISPTGGNGGYGGVEAENGEPGETIGGGGGGGAEDWSLYAVGGAGARGEVRITYTIPPSCSGTPSAATISVSNTDPICNSGTRELSATGISSDDGIETIWKYRTTPSGAYTSVSGATSEDYTTPSLTGTRYYVLETTCTNSGNSILSNEIEIEILSPGVVSTTAATTCEQGSVSLTANPNSGATIQWFATSSGGASLHSGTTFSTSITNSTTYYAEASESGCLSASRSAVDATILDAAGIINTSLSGDHTIENSDFVWVGKTSTDWSNSANWRIYNGTNLTSTSSTPSATENALIMDQSVNSTCFGSQQPTLTTTSESKSLFITPNASLNLADEKIQVYGDFINRGSLIKGTGTVAFLGSSTQYIHGETDFYNITLNKPDETYEVILEDHISLSNVLDLQGGALKLNQLSIDLGSTGRLENENENSFVYCNCPTAYIRSVGNIGAGEISNLGNLGLVIETASTKSMGSTEILRKHESVDLGDGSTNINRIYSVTPSENNGSLNATISMHYLPHENDGNIDVVELSVFRSTDSGITWSEEGGIIDPVNNTISYSNWNEFSDVTFGAGTMGEVLPVDMEYFNLNCDNNNTKLSWKTASELNAHYFAVEYSEGGLSWEEIDQIEAQGTTPNATKYEYYSTINNRTSSPLYYRLKQVDYDGKETIYGPLSIQCENDDNIVIYPNPTNDIVYVKYKVDQPSEVEIHLFDVMGKMVLRQSLNLPLGANNIPLDLSHLQKGVYQLIFFSEGKSIKQQKLVKN